jgi:histidinol-phosphate aminotransferase
MSKYISKNVQALDAYTPGEQPKDPGIIKLNTNENPYPPSPKVFEALRVFDAARLRLYPTAVSWPFGSASRRSIAVAWNRSSSQRSDGSWRCLPPRAFWTTMESIGTSCLPIRSIPF